MIYIALATINAWPNIIVAISSVASAHEKGGQAAVLVFMLVNGYFAYDASSHRHDEVRTTLPRKVIIEAEEQQEVEESAASMLAREEGLRPGKRKCK